MADFRVHTLCADLHSRTNLYEMDVRYWLEKLAETGQSGFSTETLPMLQLAADARTLRYWADLIDKRYQQLTQQELEHATQ